ncbi:MAG: glycosyltransferase family 9 protein [Bacteroidia bacterium]|nr:glycosyltransferase family 9 protein [Bacteroidia bacterium]
MSNKTEHILVIRLSALGDVAMAQPVLKVLSDQYPHLKITVLTKKGFASIFKDLERLQVVEGNFKNEHKGVLGLYRLSKKLKTLQLDAIADLHNVLRSNILKIFLNVKTKQIDKGRTEKRALINGSQFMPLKTTHQRYADVFNILGYPVNLANWTPTEKASLSLKLKHYCSSSNQKLIGIAPFAAHKGKMYPLALMKEVIRDLVKDYKVLLFGGGNHEIELLSQIENEFNNAISVAGKLSLEEELQIISNLSLMLSMDSGNAHLAAIYGIKTITIWGVTHPYAGFAPFNQPSEYMLLPDRKEFPAIPTSVYGNKYPKYYELAAASIDPKLVIEKIRALV